MNLNQTETESQEDIGVTIHSPLPTHLEEEAKPEEFKSVPVEELKTDDLVQIIDEDEPAEYEVETILDKKKQNNTIYYFVRWKNFSDDYCTWEPRENLENAPLEIKRFEKQLRRKREKNKKKLLLQRKALIQPFDKNLRDRNKKSSLNQKSYDFEIKEEHGNDSDHSLIKPENINNASFRATHAAGLSRLMKKRRLNNGEADYSETNLNEKKIIEANPMMNSFRRLRRSNRTTNPTDSANFIKEEVQESESLELKLEYLEEGKFKIIQKVEYEENSLPLLPKQNNTVEPSIKKSLMSKKITKVLSQKDDHDKSSVHSLDEVGSPEKEHSLTDSTGKEDEDKNVLDQYGSLEKGDVPLKVLGIRPVMEEDDLEAMISWYPRQNGFTPENSRVMRFEMLKKGYIMPFIEYYESKMKLENASNVDFGQIPK